MTDVTELTVQTVQTRLGWIGLVGRDGVLRLLTFGHSTRDAAIRAAGQKLPSKTGAGEWNTALAERLSRYAEGQPVDFDDVLIDTDHLSTFQLRVVELCRAIPYASTISYKQLAEQAGSPRAARAVGSVMRTNRFPLVVPCHRVLASDGGLGGYSAPGGLRTKRRLLDLERAAQLVAC